MFKIMLINPDKNRSRLKFLNPFVTPLLGILLNPSVLLKSSFFFQRDHILLEPTSSDVLNCVSKGKSQVN